MSSTGSFTRKFARIVERSRGAIMTLAAMLNSAKFAGGSEYLVSVTNQKSDNRT